MGECQFRHFLGVVGAVTRPIAERRTEAMHRNVSVAHAIEYSEHRVFGKAFALLRGRENQLLAIAAFCLLFFDDAPCRIGKRNAVVLSVLVHCSACF